MSVVDCLRKSGAYETFELHAQDSKKNNVIHINSK